MKVILFGSTGFIGREVLNQSLKNPKITSIVALSRHGLPEDSANPKLTVIIVEDFKSYSASLLKLLEGSDACIWSMGTYNWDSVVELEYPVVFQEALLKILDVKKNFRYVYLGGAFTETDQEKSLWFYREGRRVRGLAQAEFLEFGRLNQHVKTFVVRPAAVLAGDGCALLGYLLPTVSVRQLAAVMVDLALHGGDEQVIANEFIIKKGMELLRANK